MASQANSDGLNEHKLSVHPNRRRDKPQMSCHPCRRRKLKCDRQLPCGSCRRRGSPTDCNYIQPTFSKHTTHICRGTGDLSRVQKASAHSDLQPIAKANSTPVHEKINQLEGMVISMMKTFERAPNDNITSNTFRSPNLNHSSSELWSNDANSNPRTPDVSAGDFGKFCLAPTGTSYVDNSHWAALLDGITELKGQLAPEVDPSGNHELIPTFSNAKGPELLYGGRASMTKEQIISSLPPRSVVDRIVTKFFAYMDMVPFVLHGPTFLREYEEFWEAPSDTPIMWIGLLFTTMCLATLFAYLAEYNLDDDQVASPDAIKCGQDIKQFREKAVQCLILGKYTKPQAYGIETLVFYFTIEHFFSQDTQSENWILLGLIVRLALQMGYHRDPSHSELITPYQGEMRRRVWATIVALEMAISHQNGLPRMINFLQSDTQPPRNLLDDDFDENTIELPPARPETTHTTILYLIVKNRYLNVIGKIIDLTTSMKPPEYGHIIELDKMLHQVNREVPKCQQMRPLKTPFIESPDVVLKRIYLAILSARAQCLLHRKFLSLALLEKPYTYSRQSCIHAAMQILEYQIFLHEESQIGGNMQKCRWKISSLIHHDFFLAATILCVDLDNQIRQEGYQTLNDEMIEELTALEKSYRIWLKSSHRSREAYKAARAIMVVLNKVAKATSTLHSTTQGYRFPDWLVQRPMAPKLPKSSGVSLTPAHISRIEEDQATRLTDDLVSETPTLINSNAEYPEEASLDLGSEEWISQFTWEEWDMQMGNSNWGPSCPLIHDS